MILIKLYYFTYVNARCILNRKEKYAGRGFIMERNAKFYWKLFSSTFYISAFTFGGGFVIIPLMKKKFVDEFKWLEEEDMMNMMAIAQSSPGAIAVNASIIIGYRLAGIAGVLISILGTVLPPLVILSVISIGYTAFRDSVIVQRILRGMQAGVAAVIIDVVISMVIKQIKEKKLLPLITMCAAFLAAVVFQVNVMIIILVCGVIGAAAVLYEQKKKGLGKKS